VLVRHTKRLAGSASTTRWIRAQGVSGRSRGYSGRVEVWVTDSSTIEVPNELGTSGSTHCRATSSDTRTHGGAKGKVASAGTPP
jgi:hypothetical protein